MNTVTSLHTELPASDAAGAPKWVHLVPAGSVFGVDGRGPYSLGDAAAVIAASMSAGKLPIDEMHATDHGMKTGGAAPARGWVVEMQSRDTGVWGRVEWTGPGKQLMADQAYRGISPVIAHDASGRISRVLRAGLTNAPNLPLATLHTQTGATMDIPALRKALGLPETADDAAILAAAGAAHTAVTAHTAQIARITEAAGLAKDAGIDVVITSLQTQRAGSTQVDKMATELVALQTQLNTVMAGQKREKATAVIDAAMADGKPIPPALREHFIARHVADPASVETELGAMTSLHSGGVPPRLIAGGGAGKDVAGLSGLDTSVAAMMGVDPVKMAATRAARVGA